VSFTNDRMVVESASLPRVNGVRFDVTNDSRERHQLAVFDDGIPYAAKGFIEGWQPFHRTAGQAIEPGHKLTHPGIFVHEAPLTPGRRFLLFCNAPGHYARGEHAELMVK
jgi:hypothetical protein